MNTIPRNKRKHITMLPLNAITTLMVITTLNITSFSTQAELSHNTADMSNHSMQMQGGSAPSDARDPHAYADGFTLESGPYVLPGPRQLKFADEHSRGGLLVDRLERVFTSNEDSWVYDGQMWYGQDYDRVVVKLEGDIADSKLEESSTELLWNHAITTFWNTQLGARYDTGEGPDQRWLAFGIQGLSPYWFEIDATAYVSDDGQTALSLEAEYELLLTQRLVLQPRLEMNLYGKNDAERKAGKGLSDLAIGMRLRYELTRQFAPYVGVDWAKSFGNTADFIREDNATTEETRWLAGLRFWF